MGIGINLSERRARFEDAVLYYAEVVMNLRLAPPGEGEREQARRDEAEAWGELTAEVAAYQGEINDFITKAGVLREWLRRNGKQS